MGLVLENIIESIKEFFRGIICSHKWIDYGIKDRCAKCGRIRNKPIKDPLKHCQYAHNCSHVDGYLCDVNTCDMFKGGDA